MKMPFETDEIELVQRTLQGDDDAFRDLVLSYETSLLTYLQSMLGDRESARDIAQETFVAVYFGLSRWTPPKQVNIATNATDMADSGPFKRSYIETHPLAPWLYQIATNRAITFLKKHAAHKRVVSLDDYSQDAARMVQNENRTELEDRLVAQELLRDALGRLEKEDATYLVLRFVSGERYIEIAERLGTTKEAVRKRVARGLRALRASYKALEMEVSK